MGSIGSSLPDSVNSAADLQQRLESVVWSVSDEEIDLDALTSTDEQNTRDENFSAFSSTLDEDVNSSESGIVEETDAPPEASSSTSSSPTHRLAEEASLSIFDLKKPSINPESILTIIQFNRVTVRKLQVASLPGHNQLSFPRGFCLGLDEAIVIADTNNNRICIYDGFGALKNTFGTAGTDRGRLWNPTKIEFIRDTIAGTALDVAKLSRYVICDRQGRRSRMQIFTCGGEFILEIVIEGIYPVEGLAITPEGHIVAVNSCPPAIIILNQSGEVVLWFDCSFYVREPSDLAIANNRFYICDYQGHCVVIFSDTGDFLGKIGSPQLTPSPTGVHVSEVGDVFVSFLYDGKLRLAVFDEIGNLLGRFKTDRLKVNHPSGLKMNYRGDLVTLDRDGDRAIVLKSPFICNYKTLSSLSPTRLNST